MNEFAWIAPLKEGVLLLFFLVFSGVVWYATRMPGLDELSRLPFEEER